MDNDISIEEAVERYSGLSDEKLLSELEAAREKVGRLNWECEKRFNERGVKTIEGGLITATQRQDTEKYVFSKSAWKELVLTEDFDHMAAQTRQIGRPYVSLSRKAPEEQAL